MLLWTMLMKSNSLWNINKLRVGCLNHWNGSCEQDDDTVKHARTATLCRSNESDTTADHTKEKNSKTNQTDDLNKTINTCIMAVMINTMGKI